MGNWFRRSKAIAAGAAATLTATLLAGCSTGSPGTPDHRITVWSLENLAPRMAVTKKIVQRFEDRTGISVKLVGVDESQLPQLIMSSAAAGNLPDVIGGVPLAAAWQMYSNGLLDTGATREVVDRLGAGTFEPNALRLTRDAGRQIAVPSDSWMQIVAYRKDLFARRNLAAPTSYGRMLKAAGALDHGAMSGMSLASDPSDVFTQQSFEDLATAGGCELADSVGHVTLDSPRCRRTFATYGRLAGTYGPPGTQTVDTTRDTYFAGRSGMVVWSSMLLDELAGLRSDALPSCPACRKDRSWLADHTGVVTTLSGDDGGRGAQFGEVSSWTVTRDAEKGASEKFIQYMMGGGYQDWFRMAPEGKIPVRQGTAEDPDKYRAAWRSSKIGLDHRVPFDKAYPPALLDQLADGVGHMKRWGILQGQGALLGATMGELPVPKAVGELAAGQVSAAQAAREADEEVESLSRSLR
ncbi:ABC transporter substrate-binding protein [Streptomyces sp. NPDC059740]|uniref:ABC transporter substrate-binding protein n=1 Tax=Streptomyces sp. NPDC059740 TaxID=3346926 RepID=UPI00366089E6